MAKQIKDKWLGARVDPTMQEAVDRYTEAAEVTMGQLVRKAVVEYMKNHPVDPVTLTKVTTKSRSLV